MYIPKKGDIVYLNFDPSSGHEIMKSRPAIVISRKSFNEHTGFAIVAPITNTVRKNMAIELVLPNNLKTTGAVLIHQLKSIDYESRNIQFIEKAPNRIINDVTAFAKAIVE